MTDRHDELMVLAARLWTAAEGLDALHGTEDRVWRWTHRKVAELTRQGRQEDPEAIRKLVGVLERRLEKDRKGVGA